ncbi:MAG: preQ(1) synthase [Halobacteriovoraceae bacterium]|nr:preQ(1) synthase [Halobacteriovoraceae bacterium]MCB9094144.1 preQ(1) synthase [Halobacteriovoraceae bacterium]
MSGRQSKELEGLSHLGNNTQSYQVQYNPELLEKFVNKNPENDQWVSFVCTEFTSLCPITGQPDFAKIFINYIADKHMVESKSLKLYLFSFRNHGDFHEDCVQKICNDISKLIAPKFIEVIGEFTPRGGIAIYPYSSQHNGEAAFETLHQQRMINYKPGAYSFSLGRPY